MDVQVSNIMLIYIVLNTITNYLNLEMYNELLQKVKIVEEDTIKINSNGVKLIGKIKLLGTESKI